MPIALTTITVIPKDLSEEMEFGDLQNDDDPSVTGLPASVIFRIAGQRRIEDEGSGQGIRAVIRIPSYAPTVQVGDSIIDESSNYRYLVRSVVEPRQFGRWRKIIGERDM